MVQRSTITALAVLLAFLCLSNTAAAQKSAVKDHYKFYLGLGKPAAGYAHVLPSAKYDKATGYGYDFETMPATGNSGENSRPYYFSVNLPEGNYTVTISFGGQKDSTATTVKMESRRLLLEKVTTAPGKLVTRTFTVNLKMPQINDSVKVSLKPRELTKLDWDDKLTFEFSDAHPAISTIDIVPAPAAVTVFLAGNSTVVDQDDEPWASWGQMIPKYFKAGLAIANHAESGLTLGSFLSSKRLQKILSIIKPGDYLFVEFGHNDQKEKGPEDGAFKSYQQRLRFFISEVRKKKGIPVLVTPTNRRTFDDSGLITNSLGDYPDAVRRTASEEQVPLIDLNAMTKQFYEALGSEKSKKAFVHYPAGTYPGQTTELKDNTHFNSYGAYELAKCIVEGIKTNKLGLASFIMPVPAFDPAHPDLVETFSLPASPKSTVIKPDGN